MLKFGWVDKESPRLNSGDILFTFNFVGVE